MRSKQGGSNYNLYREFMIWDDQIVISCNHFFKKWLDIGFPKFMV